MHSYLVHVRVFFPNRTSTSINHLLLSHTFSFSALESSHLCIMYLPNESTARDKKLPTNFPIQRHV